MNTEDELRAEIKRLEGDRDGWMRAYLNRVDALRIIEGHLASAENCLSGYVPSAKGGNMCPIRATESIRDALAKVREALKP